MSISKVDAAQGLSAAIQEMLNEYVGDVEEKTDEVLDKASKSCAKQLKSSSPVGEGPNKGRYAKGWSVKKDKSLKGISKIGDYTVHNKTDWQLTHLLENGHVIKNQYGSYSGRVPAVPHIKDAEQAAISQCLSDLEAKL